ncbi:hypothetical protein WN944_012800 [Citrus x changshan-huyou]|uniref:Uncharacterized protein n=1 Tax=Citrus x changshan-huyou TaxID=2935761 RepID=A0AAP0QNF0_9ROSI
MSTSQSQPKQAKVSAPKSRVLKEKKASFIFDGNRKQDHYTRWCFIIYVSSINILEKEYTKGRAGDGSNDVVGSVGVAGERKRAILRLILLVVVGIGCTEIDARASFEGREEGGDYSGAHPACHVAQAVSRYYAVTGVVIFHYELDFRIL